MLASRLRGRLKLMHDSPQPPHQKTSMLYPGKLGILKSRLSIFRPTLAGDSKIALRSGNQKVQYPGRSEWPQE